MGEGLHLVGLHPGGDGQAPHQIRTGGMYPTGMYSCFVNIFVT